MAYAERQLAAAESRGDRAAARYWRRIAAVVDQAPPLTAAQRDRLRVLMRAEPAKPTSATRDGLVGAKRARPG
jgi:hypothetical protein